jgi:hypothetical protein
MPFDAAPVVRSPLADNIAGQSALVLDMVEFFFFEDGAKWNPRVFTNKDGARCLLGAIRFVRQQIACAPDRAPHYLVRAIHPARPDFQRSDPQPVIFRFNDAPGRTYAEVAAVVRKAKELAEADARAPDADMQRLAVDTDPIEARVIDEALKILGPNGEKWIKGRETDRQHNHCMVGAISLARRRLKVKDDATKDLVLKALRQERQIPHIEAFNDNPGRGFKSVREIMLLAKREAMSCVGG